MRLDASYIELSINTIHLLYSDFNDGPIQPINNESIQNKAALMTNFVLNALKGYFNNSADSHVHCRAANLLSNCNSFSRNEIL